MTIGVGLCIIMVMVVLVVLVLGVWVQSTAAGYRGFPGVQ